MPNGKEGDFIRYSNILHDKCNDDQSIKHSEFHRHDHEFLGSTRLAELEEDPHNHRFAGVSGPAIKVRGGHVHEIKAKTDFYEDHSHVFKVTSGLQKPVGDGRHVHFVEATTNEVDGHTHDLIFATLIENPIGEEEEG